MTEFKLNPPGTVGVCADRIGVHGADFSKANQYLTTYPGSLTRNDGRFFALALRAHDQVAVRGR